MHSKGIRHDDIKPENIMFRKNRIFLIDFNLSSKILEKKHGGTLEYTARRTHTLDLRTPMDDWESFLYVLAGKPNINFAYFTFLHYLSLNCRTLRGQPCQVEIFAQYGI